MRNFRAFESMSQGASGAEVLFLDQAAPTSALMDAAEWRLGAARGLLEAFSVCALEDGYARLLGDATRAALLLIEDADALYQAARRTEGAGHD